MSEQVKQLNVQEILELLPHRYPFLLIDRVLSYEVTPTCKKLRGIKNVTFNEPFFQGHFPAKPIFPGVLILEAMAQATGVLAFTMVGKPAQNELYYFASIDEAKFKRQVVPGDQLVIEVEYLRERRGVAKFTGRATVDAQVACTATLMCAKREI